MSGAAELRKQLDSFIDQVTGSALDPLLGSDLPFVRDALDQALKAAGLNSLLSTVESKINQALNQVSGGGEQLAHDMAAALDAIGNGVSATSSGLVVTINLVEHGAIKAAAVGGTDSGIAIDVGNDALGFTLKGGAHVDLGYDLDATLTFDVGTQTLMLVDKAGDLVTLHLDAALDGLQGHGALGILQADVVDKLNDPAKPEVSLVAGLDIKGDLSGFAATDAPIADKVTATVNGHADLDLGLTVGAINPAAEAAAVLPEITTDLTAHYALTDYDPIHGTGGGGTPTVTLGDIELDVGSALTFIGNFFKPILDTIFDSFPIKQLLNTLTTPLPLINDGIIAISGGHIENDPADLINFIKDNSINLLDLAAYGAELGPETKESIAAFSKAVSLIHALSALADETANGNGKIALGDIVLIGDQTGYHPASETPMAQLANFAPMDASADDPSGQLGDALDNDPNKPTSQPGYADPAASLSEILGDSGFSIPLLTDPGALIGLLVNPSAADPTTLVSYHIPKLRFEAGFDKFFPIIGPIGVGVHGGFGAGIDVSVGYDTAGLAKGKGFTDGFFFTTVPLATPIPVGDDDPQKYANFEPAGSVHAELDAYAGVDVGIASAGVGGGVYADLFAYLKGSEGDGKLRLADFGAGCIFDPITGEFGVKVNAFVKVGFSPFSYTKRWDLVKVVLANFEFGCMSTETDPEHGLAALGAYSTAANVLTLNAGEHAHDRQIGGKPGTDIDESYVIEAAPNGALSVSAFGSTDINGHPKAGAKTDDKVAVSQVIAHMGAQDDQVAFHPDVAVKATLWGDDGNDLLATGTGKDQLHGGANDDRLIGGGGDDYLFGDEGGDVLEGGAGKDVIDGGQSKDANGQEDVDEVTYENSAAGVTFTPITGKTGWYSGTGGEGEGDTLKSIEHLTGSHYADKLYVSAGQYNIQEGLDGVDILVGSSQQDLLLGGAKGDVLQGGGGIDTASYLTSAGQVYVNLATGNGFGGDAQGDALDSVENIQGSFGDDLLIGSASANVIDGWFGDDVIQGGAGKDEVHGGEGDDVIEALGDHDTIDGGGEIGSAGQDLLTYALKTGPKGAIVNLLAGTGDDTVTRATYTVGEVTVTLAGYSTIENVTGSAQDDALTGDKQANILDGGAGNDRLDGSDGNDTLIGGAGGDVLIGGDGRDLADYHSSYAGVVANLTSGSANGGDATGDKLYQKVNGQNVVTIEDLRGSDYADKLTGSAVDNRIDPGLSRTGGIADTVDGGGFLDHDTLVIDWSRGDEGKGLVGGFASGSLVNGSFKRQEATSTEALDVVTFTNIERLEVIGTTKNDIVSGGQQTDFIRTGDGNDIVYSGRGYDDIDTGAGNDAIAVGTDVKGILSLAAGQHFGLIDGGSGVDILSLSLAASTDDVVLHGTNGLADFTGTNLVTADGSTIRNMEVLYAVATGAGDDDLAQVGRYNNVFAAGGGEDRIDAGLGKDVVDGGLDFGAGVVTPAPDGSRTLVTITDNYAQAYDSDGDWLTVDYSKGKAGITSSVTQVSTGYTLARDGFPNDTREILTNNGYYQSGVDRVDFSNIERVTVTGTAYADAISGTDLTYGANEFAGPDQGEHAADSKRGDDVLIGGGGNDVIAGGTGSDQIAGGAGDDVLIGTKIEAGRAPPVVDRGEVDQMSGGTGRDVFVLGTSQPYYSDKLSADDEGYRHASRDNRAVIRDFSKTDDYLLLAAQNEGINAPTHIYTSVEQGGNTYIYLRDGQDFDGKYDPSRNELIAELDGVTGLDLTAKYAVYYTTQGKYVYADGSAAPAPGALNVPAAAPQARMAAAAVPADPFAALTAAAAPTATGDGQAIADADLLHARHAVKAGLSTETGEEAASKATLAAAPVVQPMATTAPAHWVTQTADVGVLKSALFGANSPFNSGNLTIDGNSAAFGTFSGDPFGLGQGVVLSTGRVADLAGANTVDGGHQPASETPLHFEYAGRIGSTDIYRADLSQLGHDINSIRLQDNSNGQGGGSGEASGFDLDALALSRTYVDTFTSLAQFNTTLKRVDAFDFNLGATEFKQGIIRPTQGTLEYTAGVDGGLPELNRATLGTVDGYPGGTLDHGSVTLGDGGRIGFDLNQTVKTDEPLYLYVGETGGSGEQITTASGSASSGRLDAPADLSTDFGLPGEAGDTTTLTYTFNTRNTDPTANLVEFDFVVFSEEFAEFANKGFDDTFKVMLNGVNMAHLSDGAFASIDTLATPPASATQQSSIWNLTPVAQSNDLVLNPVGTGPAASQTRADGYSRVLRFVGQLNPGESNVLTVQVADHGDGLLDSGILLKGGSVMTSTEGSFAIDRDPGAIHEGQSRNVAFGIDLPSGARLDHDVSVIFTPTADVDLGAGVGRAVVRTLAAADPHATLSLAVVGDGRTGPTRYDAIGVQVRGLDGTETVAPLVVRVDDSKVTTSYTVGDAPVAQDRTHPTAWADAWHHAGLTIDHTANLATRTPAWSAVTFSSTNPDTLAGGDIAAGDLGVSGNARVQTSVPQEIASTEGLRFTIAGQDVSAMHFTFSHWDRGDTAQVSLYDAAGKLVATQQSSAATLTLDGVHDVASAVVSAVAGSFLVHDVTIAEDGTGTRAVPMAAEPMAVAPAHAFAGVMEVNHALGIDPPPFPVLTPATLDMHVVA